MIPFFEPYVTEPMLEAVSDALRNEKLVMGESVFKFEQEFARYVGVRHAVSVNSGNSALFLSLSALGIGPGKRAATSTNSFIASASSISATGAEPVLCDIDKDTGNIDIGTCPREPDALVPVHIYGNPCDWDAVRARADELGIPIVEDACQAHGAEWRGRKVGSLGAVGCFSFYTTKNMSVLGDGGMITTDDEDLAAALASMRDNGRASPTEHDRLGYTMRLNTANAAAGRVSLRALDANNARRREIASAYRKRRPDLFLQAGEGAVFHQIVAKHPRRDEIRAALERAGIGTATHYPTPIHKQPLYRDARLSLPVAERFAEQVLSLPSFPQLSTEQVGRVSDCLAEAI